MAKKNRTNAFGAVLLVLILSGGFAVNSSTTDDSSSTGDGSSSTLSECEDGIDNDNDGYTDVDDPQCSVTDPSYDGSEAGSSLLP